MSSLDQLSELKKWKKRKGPVNKEYTEGNLKKGIKINAENIKKEMNDAAKMKKGTPAHKEKLKTLNYDLAWQSIAKKKVGLKEKTKKLKEAKANALKEKLPTSYKKTSLKKK